MHEHNTQTSNSFNSASSSPRATTAQSPSQVPQQGSRDSGCDEDEDGASQRKTITSGSSARLLATSTANSRHQGCNHQ